MKPKQGIEQIIKTFNRYFLKNYLETNEETQLFVFFLNPNSFGSFAFVNYNFIIERLIEIKAKHFIVFNDYSNSGILIDFINIRQQIYDIFVSNQELLIDIFEKIRSYNHEQKY